MYFQKEVETRFVDGGLDRAEPGIDRSRAPDSRINGIVYGSARLVVPPAPRGATSWSLLVSGSISGVCAQIVKGARTRGGLFAPALARRRTRDAMALPAVSSARAAPALARGARRAASSHRATRAGGVTWRRGGAHQLVGPHLTWLGLGGGLG